MASMKKNVVTTTTAKRRPKKKTHPLSNNSFAKKTSQQDALAAEVSKAEARKRKGIDESDIIGISI